jgi:hypothetical protein
MTWMKTNKCPVIVNRSVCGLKLIRIGTLDERLKPSYDVYICAKGHRTYSSFRNHLAELTKEKFSASIIFK